MYVSTSSRSDRRKGYRHSIEQVNRNSLVIGQGLLPIFLWPILPFPPPGKFNDKPPPLEPIEDHFEKTLLLRFRSYIAMHSTDGTQVTVSTVSQHARGPDYELGAIDAPIEYAEDLSDYPDGGRHAWLVVFGVWCALLSLIHISEPTRQRGRSRMPSSA